jgi:hypothetical protein
MKERLTYGIFILFSIYFLLDLWGKAFANPAYDLGEIMPELSQAFKCVLACWFGKEVYQTVTTWIEKRAEKAIQIADYVRRINHDSDEVLIDADDEAELVEDEPLITSKD